MTLLEAIRARNLFTEYRKLALEYWAAVRPINRGPNAWMAGPGAPLHEDTEASIELRRQLKLREVEAVVWAQRLGVSVSGASYPAPAVGGPVAPFNLLACVVDQRVGHSAVSRAEVLDALDSCIGAAQMIQTRLIGRLLKPWCWLIDVPALIVSWPFTVMARAGVSKGIVESTFVQLVKTALIAALYLLAAYLGYKVGIEEFLRAFSSSHVGVP